MHYVLDIKSMKMLGDGYALFVLIDDPRRYPRLSVYSIRTPQIPAKISPDRVIKEGTLLPEFVAVVHFPIIKRLRLKLEKAERMIRELEAAHLRMYVKASKKVKAA